MTQEQQPNSSNETRRAEIKKAFEPITVEEVEKMTISKEMRVEKIGGSYKVTHPDYPDCSATNTEEGEAKAGLLKAIAMRYGAQ